MHSHLEKDILSIEQIFDISDLFMTDTPPFEKDSSLIKKIFHQDHPFWLSTWGQRFLLVLSPFLFSPNEAAHDDIKILFSRLKTGFLSPLLGAFFLTSSLIVTLKSYQKMGLHFEWLIDFGSSSFFLTVITGLSLLTYNAAFARWLAPIVATFRTRDQSIPRHSFQFWAIRYGGILVFTGFVSWMFTAVSWFNLPLWAFFTMIGVLIGLLSLAKKEIRYQYQRLHHSLPTQHSSLVRSLELIFFVSASSLEAIVFIYAFFGMAKNT